MIRHILLLAVCTVLAPTVISAPAATSTPAVNKASTVTKPPGGELPEALQKARELAEKKDYEGAVKILRSEAGKGNAMAANALGEMYLAGRGVKASPAEAQTWFQKAADASLPEGMFNLSSLLAHGAEGVEKNEAKAKFLTRAAAEAGLADAQVRMGNAAENDAAAKPGTQDYSEARAWFEKAAAQNHPVGLLALMRFADSGFGGPADLRKGAEYCRRAARAGSIVAMNEMGVRYQKGLGVPEDNVAAIGWFSLAAQHGQLAAFVNLGHCYETGDGVRQDFDIAGRNYAAAAKQNFAPAQLLLGQLLELGKGTKADPMSAYVLYMRAAAQKMEGAEKKAEELKKKLTPAQIEEAEKALKNGSKP
jgi:TPR repeat protein